MRKFGFRQIPLPIWKEIVEFCQELRYEHDAKEVQYIVAKELGYEIDEMDAALASVRF
jgi:hypothetical protein